VFIKIWRMQYKKLYSLPETRFTSNSVTHAILANLFLRLIEKIFAFLDTKFVCLFVCLFVRYFASVMKPILVR
jgi:hypothetical protein